MRKEFLLVLMASFLLTSLVFGDDNPDSSPIQSPQLKALAIKLDEGDKNALEEFWLRIDGQHSPLVESLTERPNETLYTFLWRADPTQETINIRLWVNSPKRSKNNNPDSFIRLRESNVWFSSYLLPSKSKILYGIGAPRGSLPISHELFSMPFEGSEYVFFPDPLNPNSFEVLGASPSYVEGPKATLSPYLSARQNLTRGTLETLTIDSEILAERRNITVYKPAHYSDSSQDLGFMLVFDGEDYIRYLSTPLVLDNMIADSVIPPLIVAFITSPNRDRDLLPNNGVNFQGFIRRELLPAIRKRYNVSRNPRYNAVVGFSLGGLAAIYTAFTQPDLFGNAISQGGSLWWGPQYFSAKDYVEGEFFNTESLGLIQEIAEAPTKAIRFYIDVGIWENASGLIPNRTLYSVLKSKGYEIHYNEFLGGHQTLGWRDSLPNGLLKIWGGG